MGLIRGKSNPALDECLSSLDNQLIDLDSRILYPARPIVWFTLQEGADILQYLDIGKKRILEAIAAINQGLRDSHELKCFLIPRIAYPRAVDKQNCCHYLYFF